MPGQQGQGFLIKIRISHPRKLAIRPGMTCRAEIFSQSDKNALAVPVAAVLFKTQNDQKSKSLFSDSGAYVFVDDHGKAKRVNVKLGISSDTWQVIKSGLKAGEKIITGPYNALHSLTSGMSVTAHTLAPSAQSD